MDPLSASASIIAVLQLGGTVAQYLNSIRNAPKERDVMFREISSTVGVLFLMKSTVERTKEQPSLGSVRSLTAPGGLLEQFQKILERLASKLAPTGTALKRIGRVLHWPFAKDEIVGILGSIERIKTRFLVALQADHLDLSIESKASIEKLGDNVEAIRITQDDEAGQRMLDWLSPINVAQKQQDIIDQHQEGTGSWFLESPEFVEWIGDNESSCNLFCPGDPGTGKTVMLSLAVDYLTANLQAQAVAVAFAFCRYNEPDTRTGASIIASLVKQLAVRNGTVHSKLSDLYHKLTKDKKRMSPSTKDLHSLLLHLASTFDRVFLLVDGLDECDKKDRATLLSALKDLSSLPQCKVRVMVTARPHAQDINLAFQSSTRLEIKAQQTDVENYIRSQLENNAEILEVMAESEETDLEETVVSSISLGASGLFLAAVLQLERIFASDSVKEIKDTLTTMPNSLTEMYAQSLERIAQQPESRCRRGRRILAWILKAYRPLAVDELLHALAVEECDQPPRQLDRSALVQPKVLLDVCAGLVTIESSSKTVRFIHATTHEFISALENEYMTSANQSILKACVNYMSFKVFANGPSASDEDLNLRLREYPFLTYSAQFWGRHLAAVEDAELEKTTLKLLDSEEALMTINQAAHLSNFKFPGYSQLFPKQVTPLHLASSFGLLSMVVLFSAAHQKDLDSLDSFGWTALHRAAENGHEHIVKFLVEKECDVNQAAIFGGTALHRAAKNGHARIAALLLGSEKTLVDVQDNYGGTALHRAARDGHRIMAQLLFENGADVNRKYSFIAALSMLKKNGFVDANATSRGYQYVDVWRSQDEAMARNEAELTASDRLQGGTALHEAAGYGHEGVVELLLQSGAMVDALDNFGATPLHRAASNGHVETIRLLRQNGAHFDHSFYHGAVARGMIEKEAYRERHRHWKAKDWVFRNMMAGSPLRQAAKTGQEHTVRLLLSYDPNPNTAGQFGGSVLHQAAQSGHTEIVKLLLENGADVDTVDDSSTTHRGGTPLHSAAADGHLEVTRLLLKAGANVNQCRGIGASHATPLFLAARGGHEALCLLLLDHGADTDPGIGYHGITPFEEVAVQRSIDLMQLLLDHGAEKIDETAGQAAAKGQPEVVKTLLQNGADPNRRMRYPNLPTRNRRVMRMCPYETILGAAIFSADISTVDLLLSKGADPDMAWPRGKRPLSLAMSLLEGAKDDIRYAKNWDAKEANLQVAYQKKDQEFEAIVQLLVQKGADITNQDAEGNTPLHLAARQGFDRLVAIFLAGGADVNLLNSNRESPLFLAAAKAHLPTLQLLLDAGARVEDGVSPLYEAASEEAAQLLLRHGAEIHELDEKRSEALISAASNGVESVVKKLLERGEHTETTDCRGQYALGSAIENNELEAVRVLLDHGADRPDRYGTTPLLTAVDQFRGSEAVALLLVERGADINVKDGLYGRSVLGMAAMTGMETLVRTLLDHGLPIDFADNGGRTPLNLAASNGHNDVVQLLLQNGAKVDFTGHDRDFSDDSYRALSRSTPLCAAMQDGHISTVRLLADAGAAIFGSTPDEYKDPFVCAASRRHLDALKVLLDIYAERKSGGPTVNPGQSEPQDHGSAQQVVGTPSPDDSRLAASLSATLDLAVKRGNLETVVFLLQKGTKLSNDSKSSMVSWYPRRSSSRARMGVTIYLALLDAGAAFNFEEVFHTALDQAELALAQRLLPKLRPSTSSPYAAETEYEEPIKGLDGTPLFHAAEAGYEELVQQLLDAGFDPDAALHSETRTCTALTLAAENGHVAIVELLWRGEAKIKFLAEPAQFLLGSEYERICVLVAQDIPDPNFASEDGERILHRAAVYGHARVMGILLSRGVDTRITTSTTFETPLHCAVRSRNPAILQLLFAHGAKPDIEARDALGRTPLSHAAEGGCDAVAKFLLQHGAKTNTHSTTHTQPPDNEKEKSKWGRSTLPWHAVLEQPSPGDFAPLHYAASLGNATTAALLLSHGAVVDARDATGRTTLMLAAGEGARGVVQLLLDHGANPAAADNKGRTPLHHAAKGGWRGIAQLLLGTGNIDPGARDGERRTALHHAARSGSAGIIRVLLRERMGDGASTSTELGRGLDPNARDTRGWTALHEAAEERHDEVVLVLVQCLEVDPTVENTEGETPLAMAKKGWDDEIVDMLERRMGIEGANSGIDG